MKFRREGLFQVFLCSSLAFEINLNFSVSAKMNDVEKKLHLQDVKIQSIEDVDVEADHNESIHIDKVLEVKSHISTQKLTWTWAEAYLSFANGLQQEGLVDEDLKPESWLTCEDKENWLCCEDNQNRENELMNKERKEAEEVKNDVEVIEERLKQHGKDIHTADEEIRKQKIQIQDKLSIIKEKMEKLKKLKERKELLESQKLQHDVCSGDTANYTKEHLAEKLEQTRDALEQCTAAVHSLSEHATLLESERDARQKALIKLEEKLMSTSKEKQESSSDHECMAFYYNFLTSCGLRATKIAENWIEIDISDIYDDSPDASTLLLTVHFGEDDASVTVEDVTTNCSTSFIKDLIDYLKSTHELKIFNYEVQKRFHNHVKLLKEMKLLQKRFAIDWNEDEQIVRLMLGKVGQIVCTLKIQGGYPSTGEISVVEIHGADPAVIFQDNLVTNELRTLTSWIEYLDIKYSSL